jgi:hypothetical protein
MSINSESTVGFNQTAPDNHMRAHNSDPYLPKGRVGSGRSSFDAIAGSATKFVFGKALFDGFPKRSFLSTGFGFLPDPFPPMFSPFFLFHKNTIIRGDVRKLGIGVREKRGQEKTCAVGHGLVGVV